MGFLRSGDLILFRFIYLFFFFCGGGGGFKDLLLLFFFFTCREPCPPVVDLVGYGLQ